MSTVVVYKLEDLKYYVSDVLPKTTDAKYDDLMKYIVHDKWILLHPVQYILEIRDSVIIDDVVIEYMEKYGMSNVRSTIPPYNTVHLSSEIADEISVKIQKRLEVNAISPRNTPLRRVNSSSRLRSSQPADYYVYSG